ncbi:MAG: hypothetical protein R3F55_03575 [Alphaproteobacteria bacterium]
MRQIVILSMLPLLAGCGLPPAVAIASYAVDGVLLAATGKTTKDHALSVAMQQDCNMLHVIAGESICQDYEPTQRAAMAMASSGPGEEALTTTSDGRIIRVAAQPTPSLDGGLIAAAPRAGQAAAGDAAAAH